MAKALFEAGVAAPAVNLSIAREAGPNRVAQVVVGVFPPELASEFGAFGARTHKAHIALEDIPELRKLIKTRSPQVVSDPGAPWIIRDGPDRAQVPFGLLQHGSEFDNGEAVPVQPNTGLAIEDRSAIT